ncbi:hypothetical protein G6W51_14460 [Streptomyces coelicolor]|nr:hypothetical protein [Streptomyces coelicolor]
MSANAVRVPVSMPSPVNGMKDTAGMVTATSARHRPEPSVNVYAGSLPFSQPRGHGQ